MTKFTIRLYISKRKEDQERYQGCEDIGALRWGLYPKQQQENDLLPPTAAALKFHILRSNYVARMWKLLSKSFEPDLLDCTSGHGWEVEDGLLTAIITDMLPAPEIPIELTSCGCKATHCSTNQCSCRKLGLKYNEVCHSIGCENVDERFAEGEVEYD